MNKNQPKFLNKGISTPVGIIIIVLCALLAGGILAWQYLGIPKEEEALEELEEVEKPYIKVISPNGGEEWVIGNTYEIRWKAGNWSREDVDEGLFISLLGYNDSKCTDFSKRYIITDSTNPADPEKGSYSWTIESFDRIGQTISPLLYYKIEMINARGAVKARPPGVLEISDESDDCFIIKAKDETANWKTYRNEEYGFEVKYSPEIYGDFWTTGSGWWLGMPDLFSVSFPYRPPELVSDRGICGYNIAVTVVDNQQNLNSQEWLQKYGGNVGYIKGKTKEPEEININSTKGIKLEKLGGLPPGGGNIDGLVIVSKNLKIYLISLNIEQEVLPIDAQVFQDQCFIEGGLTFDQMLSTFRFLE